MLEPGVQNSAVLSPPRGSEKARMDEKGRLKLPAIFLKYFKSMGVEKVFITTLDGRMARIYPMSAWESNEKILENSRDNAAMAEDILLLANVMGGESEIDAQGRVLFPTGLRRELGLESELLWLDYYNTAINVVNDKFMQERLGRAKVDLTAKLNVMRSEGLK